METAQVVSAGVAVAIMLAGASVTACGSNSTSSTATAGSVAATPAHSSTSAPAQPTDYTRLLIRAEDINAPETFTAGTPTLNPDGKQGVATTFSNEDRSHVIVDTILILSDPAAAASMLDSAKATLPGSATGTPVPIDVGTGGTTVTGESPDGSKGVTVLRFTQGRAFATLEFDGPANAPVPPDFVTDVGHQQQAAINSGLPA